MQETTRLAALVQERIAEVMDAHREQLEGLGPDALPLLDEASDYLVGGKRLRARFTLLGFASVRPLDSSASAALDAACALELFHAAALIHDDVIDRSDTRRGRPAAHRSFAGVHEARGWRGSAEHFGVAGAILLGDLLQSWSDELMQRACDASSAPMARTAREHFNRMRSEVALGQYLDVVEEQQRGFSSEDVQLERSTRILVYKSAKYSVEAPLLIGAALAGASDDHERALSEFGLPVGVAFQLRDDLLGVFGDEELTGKPAGDDLVEGKRTVLVALARAALPDTQRRIFDDLLGDDGMDAEQLAMLQRTIRRSGAVERVEEMIARNIDRAVASLRTAPVRAETRAELIDLADRAGRRRS